MIKTEHHSEKKILRKFLINRRKHLSRDYEEKNMSHLHLHPLLNNMNSDYVGSYMNLHSHYSYYLIMDVNVSETYFFLHSLLIGVFFY